ncbi:ABC transporter ATP-binding protein [Halorientalis pallida]|uniref:Molybdate/tungstate import ATP-binding protein WtpC n=1 Tax=Halorientalis pallida TaxID=2479928 RepID=A0A498L2D2_9EURY|nr:ABC transporter ATP-binding protein [Halorientalis pallida]RXK47931.1 ABC transporter ATP-binding protein [Halorientalis pallida]
MSDSEHHNESKSHGTLEQSQSGSPAGQDAADEAILEVSGLTKIYPDGTLAVDDIDFSVQDGDFCVIIGPSGCGKSTTLHSLVGKVEVTEGTVELDGEDITDAKTHDRDIGLVFQDFQLFPHLNVEENIRYGLERLELPSSEIDQRVDEIIETMKLSGNRDRDPTELSAGQKQRVALARSLVLEPKLLLLDEPLGDMDYKLQKHMEEELLRIHREFDTTFVYVTHDQTQAMRLADQVVVMNDGKVEQAESVNRTYNSPETAFVATFVGDSNIFSGRVTDVSEDETTASIDTHLGEFVGSTDNLDSTPGDVVGQELSFSVRPQHLSLDGEGDNHIECRVLDVITHASQGTQVLLEPVADDSMELQLLSRELISDLDERVTVSWDAGATVLLERTSVVDGVDLQKDILGE